MEVLKTYKCIKKFEAEMNYENHKKEINDDLIIEPGTIWFNNEEDYYYLETVINGNHYELEVDEKLLSENFIQIVN